MRRVLIDKLTEEGLDEIVRMLKSKGFHNAQRPDAIRFLIGNSNKSFGFNNRVSSTRRVKKFLRRK